MGSSLVIFQKSKMLMFLGQNILNMILRLLLMNISSRCLMVFDGFQVLFLCHSVDLTFALNTHSLVRLDVCELLFIIQLSKCHSRFIRPVKHICLSRSSVGITKPR